MIAKTETLILLLSVGFLVSALSCSRFELKQSPSLQSEKVSQPSLVKTSKGKKVLWRGLVVADEDRCTPYDRDDYGYHHVKDLEDKILKENLKGKLRSPYGEKFKSLKESQIEHIVSTLEAHRSGLCRVKSKKFKRKFATDLDNLTLATGTLNRKKWHKDAAGWIPPRSQCWFARTVIKVKRKYGLTVDRKEKRALEGILKGCPGGGGS